MGKKKRTERGERKREEEKDDMGRKREKMYEVIHYTLLLHTFP